MKIPSHELAAFFEVAQTQSVTQAARNLFVTQSALSQRLQKLEESLESTLFVRDRKGLKLTESGHKLLRYSQSLRGLEEEVLQELKSNSHELAGIIRVAAFSSVLRSVLLPALSPFLKKNPKVNCEFQSYEVTELPSVLERGEADLVVADYRFQKNHLEEIFMGHEEYVVIESRKIPCPEDLYLDQSLQDSATETFFATQKNAPKAYRRTFMGDVYGILDGVEHGLGRAVMSKHLLIDRKNLKTIPTFKSYKKEIVLHHFKRPFYPKLFLKTVDELKSKCQELLIF